MIGIIIPTYNEKENIQIDGGGFDPVSFSNSQEVNPVF